MATTVDIAADFLEDAVTVAPLAAPTVAEPLPTDSGPEDTARAWLARLEEALNTQQRAASRFDDYYIGEHPLPELPFRKDTQARYKIKYLDLLKKSRSNWMGLVVDAEAERIRVEGFRFGDQQGDKDAWRMWQTNLLDAESEQVHTEALKTGVAYVSVWFGDTGGALIVPEHPGQTIVAHEPGTRRRRRAALKRWLDPDLGEWFATVYLPAAIWKFRRPKDPDAKWQPRVVPGEDWPLRNTLGVVPIVAFPNRPNMLTGGVSELRGVTDIQDRINAALFGRMLAMEYAAAPQRFVTGIQLEEEADGTPIEPFEVAFDRVWTSENPDTRFGQFQESDLAGYIKAVEQDIQHLAAITRTPPHYLLGQSGAFPSGESLKATETGLVAKVRRQHQYFGEAWEEVIRLGFAVEGDPRSKEMAAETIWQDPESRTEAELLDAATKRHSLQVPLPQIWEDVGYTPQQIERFAEQRASEPEGQEPPPNPGG